jgi:hypothetical protein
MHVPEGGDPVAGLTVHVSESGVDVTVKLDARSPLADPVTETVAWASPATAVTAVGAPGAAVAAGLMTTLRLEVVTDCSVTRLYARIANV